MYNFSPLDVERKIGHSPSITLVGTLEVTTDPTPADGQSTAVHWSSPAGFYDIVYKIGQTTDSGICEVRLDGVLIDTFDAYATPGNTIASRTIANVAVADGEHELEFKVNGKNAASSDYFLYHAWLHVDPR